MITCPHPVAFAEFCIEKHINLVDAIAMAPAWIYNLDGDKIGTSTRPWRLSDYVVALGLARNPIALQRRTRLTGSLPVPSSKKRESEDEKLTTKKRKIETVPVEVENTKREVEDGNILEKLLRRNDNTTKAEIKKES